jgi:ADP-ribose pyrophosphatase
MFDHDASLIPPKIHHSSLVFDEFIKIRKDHLVFNEGFSMEYYSLTTKGPAVVVLGILPDGSLLVNEEYRHPSRQIVLCFPGGYLEHEEAPIIGGRREFLEETGYDAEEFSLLGSAYPYPGISDQKIYFVLAKNAFKIQNPTPDPSEIFRTLTMSRNELSDRIISGKNVDGILGTALFFYDLRQGHGHRKIP